MVGDMGVMEESALECLIIRMTGEMVEPSKQHPRRTFNTSSVATNAREHDDTARVRTPVE
jgi:hypothetical protein